MIVLTSAARAILRDLLADHPDERIVRFSVADVDEEKLALRITLEAEDHPDDYIQDDHELIIAIAAASVERLDGVTVDYVDGTFRFEHPSPPLRELRLIRPN